MFSTTFPGFFNSIPNLNSRIKKSSSIFDFRRLKMLAPENKFQKFYIKEKVHRKNSNHLNFCKYVFILLS